MNKSLSVCSLLICTALIAGCASNQPVVYQTKAHYSEFSDITWLPETAIRSPLNSRELALSTAQAMREGIHSFNGDHEGRFQLNAIDANTFQIVETALSTSDRALSWSAGSDTLFRNGTAIDNTSQAQAEARILEDGRLLITTPGQGAFNLALQLRAYDISGKQVRQLIRDTNNRPDKLAWYTHKKFTFAPGSRAYILTYWLGDDEIVRPSKSAFTGNRSLEQLIHTFNTQIPFCLSYVTHPQANPMGVVFEKTRRSPGQQGRFSLVPVQKDSMFCERSQTGTSAGGTWAIKSIQGTRVIELFPDNTVASSDLGIQPVNQGSVSLGFAEVADAAPAGKRRSKPTYRVIPVRILHNNQPIVDFRLKFNDTAAKTLREALADARLAQQANETAQ